MMMPQLKQLKKNEMIKSITNTLPCKIRPWKNIKLGNLSNTQTPTDLLTELPEDIEFSELYVFDYNQFIDPGNTGYARMKISILRLLIKLKCKE